MNNDHCIFALPQITEDFACQHGELVTRRAGPDVACHSETMCRLCSEVYEQFKIAGLAAFEYEDDLTQVPHSVWTKIQYGGLLGLQALLEMPSQPSKVENIAAVIERAVQQYQQLEQLPYQAIVPAMQEFRIKRRRAR